MTMIALCLILGLALCIERILFLTFSKTNTKKLVAQVEAALAKGGIEEAKKVCHPTTPADPLPASSIRDSSATTRELTLSRRPSFPTAQFR